MIEPSDALRRSTERQNERYPYVRRDKHGGWAFYCCHGCHGCGGAPQGDRYPRPIDAYLARLEWRGKVPVGPVRRIDNA